MAGVVDNENRVTAAEAMYDASAEDYGDQVEDVMGGRGGRGINNNNGDNNGNGSSDDERRRQQ